MSVIEDTVFDKADSFLQDHVAGVLARQVVIAATAYLPFLAIGVVNKIAIALVTKFFKFAISKTTTGLELLYIDVRTGYEIKAIQKNHKAYVIAKNKGLDLTGVRDALAKAYRDGVRFNAA